MDAVRMGWRLTMSDFWPVWLLGLVVVAIETACSMPGMIPYIGGCISLAVGIFVQPALQAGLFYAVARKIDGAPAQVNDVFEGFRQRYWQSVVAVLPPMGISLGVMLLIGTVVAAVFLIGGAIGGHMGDEEMLVLGIIAGAICIPLVLALIVAMFFFMFSLLAVWDHPESGWEAVKDSVRVVKGHFLSVVGLILLFILISIGATLLGVIACCIGVFFTSPIVAVWFSASMIYLYRSWTGRPLVLPLAPGQPAALV
jgi:hypothetical protein